MMAMITRTRIAAIGAYLLKPSTLGKKLGALKCHCIPSISVLRRILLVDLKGMRKSILLRAEIMAFL